MISIKLPPLHAGQQVVARSRARFRVLVTGRQWGKTRFGVHAIMERGLAGETWWWVAPVYQTSEIAWKLLRKLAGQINAKCPGLIEIRLGDRALIFANGGEIICRSGDRPDNLRGPTLDGVVIDEADYLDEYIWTDVLTPALGVKCGRAILISTPRIEGGWFHRLFQSGLTGSDNRDTEVESFTFPTWTSPYFSAAALDHARRTLPSLTFRREYGAEFVSGAGVLIRREHLRIGLPERELEVFCAWDLAIGKKTTSDYTAGSAMSIDPATGFTYILEVVRDRVSFRGALAMIEAMAARHRPVVIAIEQVAYQAAVVQELLRTTRLPIVGVNPSQDKVLRFQPLAARYEQLLVRHAPGLPVYFENELLAFPVGEHDDTVDAVAYAYQSAADAAYSTAEVRGTRPTYEGMDHGSLDHLAAMG